MSIDFPSLKELVNRIKTDIQSELQNSNPFLRNSALSAFSVALAGRIDDFYKSLQDFVLLQLFPDTATNEFLERWGSYAGITRLPETVSSGLITISGSPSTIIPQNTDFQSSNGDEYFSKSTVSISNHVLSVISITRVGNTATVTTASEHKLASNIEIGISGATQTDYNGLFNINQVISETQFTYQVQNAPATPATGTIILGSSTASIEIESKEAGEDKNLENGEALTITTPIIGVDNTGYVQFTNVSGGSDQENDDSLRERILFYYANIVTPFNESQIKLQAFKVEGITRVWVFAITPQEGKVTIYCTTDNAQNIIPSSIKISEVKAEIDKIAPVNMDPVTDVIVSAPTAVPINFVFSSLTPNTLTMQQSIKNQLTAFFQESNNVGENLKQYEYQSAIYQTVDEETNEFIQEFVLSSPTGDIIINAGELPILGTITFP